VKIGPNLGKILIKLYKGFHEDLAMNFNLSNPDHHVLNIAYCLVNENPDRDVILVSKDVNLRLKAKSVGLVAQDYTTDPVKDIADLYSGRRIIEDFPEDKIGSLYGPPHEINSDGSFLKEPLAPNEFLILRNGKKSALATYEPGTQKIRHVEKVPS
jgi:PhoH-like ATPase